MTSAASFPVAPFIALIVAEGSNTAELVQVTARAGTTVTIVRNYDSQPWAPNASAHGNGATFAIATPATPVYTRPSVLTSPVDASSLPTADPHVVGQLWSNANVVTRSAG